MYPMRLFIFSGSFTTSIPATTAFPDVGRLSPQSILMAVVLPAPLAPRNPKISPFSTENEILSTAVKFPNRFVSDSACMAISLIIIIVKIHKTVFHGGRTFG